VRVKWHQIKQSIKVALAAELLPSSSATKGSSAAKASLTD